jgi:hypothetical protein
LARGRADLASCESGLVRQLAALLALATALVFAGAGAAASTPLRGVFKTTVSGSAPPLNGTWLISFAGNGTYEVVKEPDTKAPQVRGSSTVAGQTVVLVDQRGPASCPGTIAKGTYSWRLTATTLKLTKISDSCTGRAVILGGTFTRVG